MSAAGGAGAGAGDPFRPGASNSAVGSGWTSSRRPRPEDPPPVPAWHMLDYRPSAQLDPTFLRHARMYYADTAPGEERIEWSQVRPDTLKFSAEADAAHDGVRARMSVPPIGNTRAPPAYDVPQITAWYERERDASPAVLTERWNRDRAVQALMWGPHRTGPPVRTRDTTAIAENNLGVRMALDRAEDFAWARRAHLMRTRESPESAPPAAKRAKRD